MNWLITHWQDILAAYGALVAFSTIVVKFTPTTKDDEFLAKVVKFFDKFSTAFTKADAKKLNK